MADRRDDSVDFGDIIAAMNAFNGAAKRFLDGFKEEEPTEEEAIEHVVTSAAARRSTGMPELN